MKRFRFKWDRVEYVHGDHVFVWFFPWSKDFWK